jgi:hypothetical protein
MNWFVWTLGGVLLGTAAWMIWGQGEAGGRRRPNGEPPVDELAHKLQEAWADHHTTA